MPKRFLVAFAAAALIAVAAMACGGDGEEETPTPTPSATARGTRSPTPTGGSEEKTPGPEETPDGGGETSTPDAGPEPTPASEGTPAVAPDDQTGFLNQFQGRDTVPESCTYDPTTFIVTCGDRGRFAIDPPIVGQDISCSIWIVDGNPEYVGCRSQEPLRAIYYDIQ
jgi:hypothetical protein